jgi:hypothetical protein
MIEKDEKEALQDFKSSQEALSFSIGEELKTVQSRYKDLQVDHDQQKSQLIQALLSKDKLQQTVTELTELLSSATAVSDTKETKEMLDSTTADLKESKEVRVISVHHKAIMEEWSDSTHFHFSDNSPTTANSATIFEPHVESVPKSSNKTENNLAIELAAELSFLGNRVAGIFPPPASIPLPMAAAVLHSKHEPSTGRVVYPLPSSVGIDRPTTLELHEIDLFENPDVPSAALSPTVSAPQTYPRFRLSSLFRRNKE